MYSSNKANELAAVTSKPAKTAYVYACSPRAGGNSDFAAMLVRRELGVQGIDYDGCFVREYNVIPCEGCQCCCTMPDRKCRFAGQDEAGELFAPLFGSRFFFFVSPIYFYHLPARFKSFIDRGQAFWAQKRLGLPEMLDLPSRKAYAVLLAAREQGEKIFTGSLLTLKFFLRVFNIELEEPLLLRNIDASGDLAGNEDFHTQIADYTRDAYRNFIVRS